MQNPVEEVRDRRSQWFEEHPELCEPLSRAYQSFQKTVEIVFRAMAIALDAPQDYFTKLHGQQNDSMLLHHYPVLHPTLASNVLRNKEHIDYGSLSLLFQDEIGGLEVCTQAGDWIAVPPIENTPITILGNIMSRWTNDKYPGTKHRVSMPTTQHAMKERYSFGLFPAPDDRAAIACLETCLAPNEKPKYLPISTHDYYERGFQAKL
ncbi:MAG: isopenicillin N synthase family oxygenase [Hormoscilla sp. GM7CHS1pb]|nr:isopenicillin N synthase family oxygenase [Hormoscilla sp. GM7CHS1pb]